MAILYVALLLISPYALASTELHVSGAPAADLFREAAVSDLPGDAAPGRFAAPWLDESAAEDGGSSFPVGALASRDAKAAADPRHDRFSWIFLLIAFTGLTAAFAGKPSRGRGLIAG